ncbi:translesion error-prone DNA polymerase V autoproteolytic subunit (plasmid) [Aeromonas caviae]|uniref:Translesion error-prone DNA polymerase V autoproteolytic subunit n=1 Tax=Aeromonas allosaccharophila TaxID=656 RepID=A0AAX3NYA5_9GAMM|nr:MULTISPECIES: translesion error-prone DNA polymerase V autoproteolytic subunit [Aeromonas]AWA04372.1 translesion error-prone DNA polymerase V autoproteolytic subunit [Aeromonas hydrophila subsp. hydrophila]MXQ69140.1 translesion error-prone DNA polymerase V autoproteolytic subunit [Aeromonas caviae]QSO25105.1 translesion error-prone DNA polymerase V autoproteolytic subunit [Aeromonas caviae]WED79114.1 translesion error-prone DNA polymerase V autoproteolytic subunit [Aeromonas allosaccharophi
MTSSEHPLLPLPLFADRVSCGFPNPCSTFSDHSIDLNQLCVRSPASTFFVRASGDSMRDKGILDGDLLIIDRSVSAVDGDIVLAVLDGEFTVKCLQTKPCPALVPANPAYSTIYLTEEMDFQVWGVVTFALHQTWCR